MKIFTYETGNLFLRSVILFLVISFLSGSILFAQKDVAKNSDAGNSKLSILEKLESGKTVSPGEIRDFFRQSRMAHQGSFEFYTPDTFSPGPYHSWSHGGEYHYYFSDSDLEEMNYQLHKGIEEIKRNVETFRHSEEFRNMQAELQKMGEKIRKEIVKMKVEINL